jgi:hypothetical protein
LQSGLLYRLNQNGQDALQEQLPMPGQPLRQVMLQIDERGGGLGVGVPRLQVAVRPLQVLFMAQGSGPFTLALGNPAARSAVQAIAPADLAGASLARVGGSFTAQTRPSQGWHGKWWPGLVGCGPVRGHSVGHAGLENGPPALGAFAVMHWPRGGECVHSALEWAAGLISDWSLALCRHLWLVSLPCSL